MANNNIQLPEDWLEHLSPEFEKPYMVKLKAKLLEDKKNGKKINLNPKWKRETVEITL